MKVRTQIVALALVALAASQVGATITETKDSWEFSHRYEMDVVPSEADVDGNGIMDFTSVLGTGASSIRCLAGVLTINAVSGSTALYNNTADGSWRTLAPTRSSGFTVELRLRVNTHSDVTNGAIAVTATASDSNIDSLLCVGTNFVKWGYNTASVTLNAADNSDDFHTFRIAMEGGQSAGSEKFTVWRDGVLLADGLGDCFPHTGLNRLNIGVINATYIKGNVDIGYVRFTSGAYAPTYTTKYAPKDSAEFDKKFEMEVADGEVDPDGNTIEWTRTVVGSYTTTLSDGNLYVTTDSAIGAQASWQSATWTNLIAPGTPFTVEARMRVDSSISAEGDATFLLGAGNGDNMIFISIGTNHVYHGKDTTSFLDNSDNSDKMHTLRLAYDADGAAGFQIWRDGVQIGTNLVATHKLNRVYFADGSSAFGGSGAFDYVRWTAGVFEPLPPPIVPKGTLFMLQ